MKFQVNGVEVFASTGGRPFDKKKPLIIFVHGSGLTHMTWVLQTRYFAFHGYSVLALDMPGHGLSGGESLKTIEDMADWISDVIDAVGYKEASLVGHSQGCLIILECAFRFPKKIKTLNELIQNIKGLSNQEIGFLIMKSFINSEIPDKELKKIIDQTINFDFPIKQIQNNIFSFELFHGPTLAFKDVGASFLANSLEYYTKDKVLNILVATSGDTGAAVANSFFNKKNINVIILFPKNKIS